MSSDDPNANLDLNDDYVRFDHTYIHSLDILFSSNHTIKAGVAFVLGFRYLNGLILLIYLSIKRSEA